MKSGCSKQLGIIFLRGIEEIVGSAGLNAILNLAHLPHLMGVDASTFPAWISFHEITAIQIALEDFYGPKSGRGVALRAGRSSFIYGLDKFGMILHTTDPNYRLLPVKTRLKIGLESMADLINRTSSQKIQVLETPTHFHWIDRASPFCWQRSTDTPICHWTIGFLQEYMYWNSGGKYFQISERECMASGANQCVFWIDRIAME